MQTFRALEMAFEFYHETQQVEAIFVDGTDIYAAGSGSKERAFRCHRGASKIWRATKKKSAQEF